MSPIASPLADLDFIRDDDASTQFQGVESAHPDTDIDLTYVLVDYTPTSNKPRHETALFVTFQADHIGTSILDKAVFTNREDAVTAANLIYRANTATKAVADIAADLAHHIEKSQQRGAQPQEPTFYGDTGFSSHPLGAIPAHQHTQSNFGFVNSRVK